jgi:alanine racemase
VIKGNGYGLGLVELARELKAGGIDRFAVTEVSEVQRLRAAGFLDERILMLRPTNDAEELSALLDLNAIISIGSLEQAGTLNGLAEQRGIVAEVHLEIDTGMGRYGFLPSEIGKLQSLYQTMNALAVTGVYTHFHSAFSSKKATMAQYESFQAVLSALHEAGYETGEAHCCNSSALLRYPELAMDGVRVGSALLGRLSFRGNYGLQKVGVCEAEVEELRWLEKGATTGYGAAWKAKKPTRVAIVSVGYFHGFGAEKGRDLWRVRDCLRGILSNGKAMLTRKALYVTVGGKRCRVLGHIGMLHTCIDVTKVSNVALGDRVTMEINPLLVKGLDIEYRD